MDCSATQTVLASYALGALDAEQRDATERHLVWCAECRRRYVKEVRALRHLPRVQRPVNPPPYLKAMLLDSVEALEQQRRRFWSRALAKLGRFPGLDILNVAETHPMRIMGVTAAALAMMVAGWSTYQVVQVRDLAAQNAQLATTMRGQFDALAMAADPSVESVSFHGTDASPQTHGSLFLHRAHRQAALLVMGLKPADKGHVYQLWVWDTQSGSMCQCGTFETVDDGYGVWSFVPPEPLTPTLRFGVTAEPAGGSQSPTGPMLISGSLPVQTPATTPFTGALD